MLFPAHIRPNGSEKEIQTAADHCHNVGALAGSCLSSIGLEQAGMLTGLLHDCGKFKAEFARYLNDPNGIRGSVNHTFAGTRLLLERYHGEAFDAFEGLSAELLALAVGGHHGLFDCLDDNSRSGFEHRMTKTDICYHESIKNFFSQCISSQELDTRFSYAHAELLPVYDKILAVTQDPEEIAFHLGLLMRLLLSAVIDGDRRDTAHFMSGLSFTLPPERTSSFWEPYLIRVEEKIAHFPQDTSIQKARREISDRCRAFSERPGGIYRLNVPTGAGKTLSSLRYALAHARKYGKQRLIFTSPLLSILEQNAAVLRDYIGDDSIILEHHSNVLHTEESETLDARELAIESWDAPVIITTLVQLLNTLFDGRTTSIRRFQGLCSSVIVIDEVQTVPLKMLSLFNTAMDFLATVCGATVLLCSATQPYLEKTDHPLHLCTDDIVPYDPSLWAPFRRTVITDLGGRTLNEITSFAIDALTKVNSLLIVCNKKQEAEHFFRVLKDYAELSCHLSASMCTAHRRDVLERLNDGLKRGAKCLCVSTQVIEAGVDISFQQVIRLSAGMDNVIQSAGRCNRHGECHLSAPVYVVPCLDEDLKKLPEINNAKKSTDSLLDAFRRDPNQFDRDLSSEKAIQRYYQTLYHSVQKGYQDFPLKQKGKSLFSLLSCNYEYYDETDQSASKFSMTQAFRTAGALFQVFDNNTLDLIVPYKEGKSLIEQLLAYSEPEPAFLADWLKQARPYTISVYEHQLGTLDQAVAQHSGIAILNPDFYNLDTGLSTQPQKHDFLEV